MLDSSEPVSNDTAGEGPAVNLRFLHGCRAFIVIDFERPKGLCWADATPVVDLHEA